jgi:hypothetical protein
MPRTTKRRRSTKHRGNAAGMIEARGRTGRKPTSAEKGGSGGRGGAGRARTQSKTATRTRRYERPPTWKAAGLKAVAAAVVVYILSTLLVKKSVTGNLLLLPIVLALYAPLIYYTDMWMYRRYQRKQAGR